MQKRSSTENRMWNLASQKLGMTPGEKEMSLQWSEWDLRERRPRRWVSIKFQEGGD